MKTIRLRNRPGFETITMRMVYRILYFFFHCRFTLPDYLKNNDEPVVFVANHYSVFGPVSFILSIPLSYEIWMNEDIITPQSSAATFAPGIESLFPFLSTRVRNWLCEKLGALACRILVRFGSIPVNRNNPAKLFTTMRQSVASLESGKNILIFPETGYPEYSLTSVTPFFSGFATIGAVYYRKTKKKFRFVPCYIDQQHHQIRFGEPSVYEPEGTEITAETTRVSDELNLRIREMAAASQGHNNRKETVPPVLRTLLFFSNLIRFLLIIPLTVVLSLSNNHAVLILYLVSQGLRILFNGIASYAMPSSNRLSSVLSHGIALVTDIIVVAYISPILTPKYLLLCALILNALVFVVSNVITFFRIHRLAGSNYFDILCGNLILILCLLLLLDISIRRYFFGIFQLITVLMLLLSAAYTIAFNLRMIHDSEQGEAAAAQA